MLENVTYAVNKNTIYLLFGIEGGKDAGRQSGQIQSHKVQAGESGHAGYITSITLTASIH